MKNRTTRREFFKMAGLAAASAPFLSLLPGCATARPAGAGKREQPNIVLILADDLGWHQLGCYGSAFYETPNLDRLASQGMRFTDAYAAAPVCSPTRASIMTGKYPARLHLTDFIKGSSPTNKKLLTPDWTAYLPLEEITLAEALKQAGYACGHFGKWHLNKDKKYEPGRPGDPGSQGFDDVFAVDKPGVGPASKYENDAHHVREITERSIAFIENNRDKQFFCYVAHSSIHRPEIERKELVAKYSGKSGAAAEPQSGHNNPTQGAMLETLDKSIEALLNKLDELGLSDNTIVVFFSDNGHLGPKDSKTLRGSKADLYEGGIRVPLIVRWPGVVQRGSRCSVPVISNDFFPTFLEAAGVKLAEAVVDGESLMPLLKQTGKVKREAIYFHYPHYHGQGIAPSGAVRQDKYKLIEWYEKSIDGVNTEGAIELFDLEKDMNEQNNLAGKLPQKAAELYERLKQWRKTVGAQEMTRNPNYRSG